MPGVNDCRLKVNSFVCMKKRWIQLIIFILLFLLLNELLLLGLKDDVFMRSNIDRCMNNEYQDIFIGTSQCRRAVDPDIVAGVTNRSTTNASIPLSSPLDQYYLVKQICESGHTPERIVYECDPYYFSEAKSGGHYYYYPNGINKFRYFLSGLKQDWRITVAPWSFQMGNYFRMGEVFKSKLDYWFKGYSENVNGYQEGGDSFTPKDIVDHEFVVSGIADEYMGKLISLCKEEGIELILMQFPVSEEVYYDMEPAYRQGADKYFKDVADANGVEYLNFNELCESDGATLEFESDDTADGGAHFENKLKNFIDMEGHLKTAPSLVFSEDIGRVLIHD